jgi:hypothetical protein
MSDRFYRPNDNDDNDHLDETQLGSAPTGRMPIPPPPTGRGHVQVTNDRYGTSERPRQRTGEFAAPPPSDAPPSPAAVRRAQRRVQRKSDSGLFLPAWSVLAMIVVTLAVAGVIIAVVVSMGGGMPDSGEPRVMIITAVPSETPMVQPTQPIPGGVALPDSNAAAAGTPGALPTFALDGPLLPTVAVTSAPQRIEVGSRVVIINVGASRLNVRQSAGTTASVLFQANVNDTFDIIGGPETTNVSGNTLTWWQLRGVNNPTQIGWAVENDGQQDVMEVVQ